MAAALSKDVVKAQGPTGRADAALRLVGDMRRLNIGAAIHDAADVVAGTKMSPEKIALIKAAKSAPPAMATEEQIAGSALKKVGKPPTKIGGK